MTFPATERYRQEEANRAWLAENDLASGGGPGGGGGLQSAEFLFTEEATAGTYTATLPVLAGTIVWDVILYSIAGPWAADGSGTPAGWGAEVNVQDGTLFYMYQLPLDINNAGSAADPYSPPTFIAGGSPKGWLLSGNAIATSDMTNGSYGFDPNNGAFSGPGRRYATNDTITMTIVTSLAGASVTPAGISRLKIVYFTPVTADDAVFAEAP